MKIAALLNLMENQSKKSDLSFETCTQSSKYINRGEQPNLAYMGVKGLMREGCWNMVFPHAQYAFSSYLVHV